MNQEEMDAHDKGVEIFDPTLDYEDPINLCECYTVHENGPVIVMVPCTEKATTIVRRVDSDNFMVCCDPHRDLYKRDFADKNVTYEAIHE